MYYFKRKHSIPAVLALFVLLVAPPPSRAHELTRALTAENVACNELQLERLLLRLNAAKRVYITPQLPTTLLLSYDDSDGFYNGLVATYQDFRLSPGELPPVNAYEHYLTFNINSRRHALLLDPDRAPQTQVSLYREQGSSNLVEPGSYFDLVLALDLAPGGGGPLILNNYRTSRTGEPYNGFLANSTGPGRGLSNDGLLTHCHRKFTPFDRHVFAVLQRMIRAGAMSEFFPPDMEIAIFRGSEPHTYRINIYPIYENLEPRGRMAVELKLSWDSAGKLVSGRMKALPACTTEGQAGCTALKMSSPVAFLIPPVFGGRELYSNSAIGNGVFFVWYEGPSAPKNLNMAALLAGTAWNEPVW